MQKEKISKSLMGKRSRAAGRRFELKVRADLENMGWIVDKWTNTINLNEKKLIKVKNKFLGPGKPMMLGAGFPDFICFKKEENKYDVIGVEVRTRGILSQTEREKCVWYLKNKIFSKILIARKKKNGRRVKIEYKKFKYKNV